MAKICSIETLNSLKHRAKKFYTWLKSLVNNIINCILQLIDSPTYNIGKPLTVKLVFDNLRCYPLLIIFGVSAKALMDSSNYLEIFAGIFFSLVTVILCSAVAVQTGLLLTTLTFGLFGINPSNPQKVNGESSNCKLTLTNVIAFLFTLLFIITSVTATFSFYKYLEKEELTKAESAKRTG